MKKTNLESDNILLLVLKMALPAMATMAFQAIYNTFDSLFIARYSTISFAAVSITMPLISITLSFGIAISTAMGSRISRALGEKQIIKCENALSTAIFLVSFCSLVITLLSIVISPYFVSSFTSDSVAYNEAVIYLRIVSLAYPFAFISSTFSFLFISHGRPKTGMVITISGALINILLDPLLIFTLNMGTLGAAAATLIGYMFSFFIALILYLQDKVTLIKKTFYKDEAKRILFLTLPIMMISCSGSIVGLFFNHLILSYGFETMAIYSMYLKVESFMFLASSGISSALVVIASYNKGAGRVDRVKKAYFLSLALAWVIMIIGFYIFQVHTELLVNLFTPDKSLVKDGIHAFKLISYCFLLSSPNIITSGLLQGLGDGLKSLLLTCTRFFVLLLPLSYILNYRYGLDGLYLSYFAADVGVSILVVFIYRLVKRKHLLA